MVQIVADTTSSLPPALLEARGIPLIPQVIIFGEESYLDDKELDTATFLSKLKTASSLPKTAAPPMHLYHPIYAAAQTKGESVVVVAPSAKVSGTVRSAEVAAQDFPGLDVHVVDTQTIAGGLGTFVLLADEWAKQGADAETIVRRLNDLIARHRTYFLVDTLEYLAKGGRIGGAKALLGELLQVKPILTIRNGQVEPFEQQRTRKRALARLAEIVIEQSAQGEEAHLCIMHVEAMDAARELAANLKSALNLNEIPIYELPPAIVVHAGPGALAVGFFTNAMV
ncbi:MAG: DegV family protein [Candidatus Villigracilaceae bacterium]